MPISIPVLRPELLNALSLLVPGEVETDLIRACLWSGERGASAWDRFRSRVSDPVEFFRHDTRGVRRLEPLLLRGLQRHGGEADPALLTTLKIARVREELRAEEYGRICAAAGNALAMARVPFILLKGAALGQTVYPQSVLRHAHDIDLLVRSSDRARGARVLTGEGFVQVGPEGDSGPVELRHSSGLPLLLHSRLFGPASYRDAAEALWTGAETLGMNDARLVLSPPDMLLHILGQAASSPRRTSLAWVADTWFIIERRPDLDWDTFVETAEGAGLQLPVFVMLRYVSDALAAQIPPDVLLRLEQAGARASVMERDLALFHARQGRSIGSAFRALRNRGWRTRLYWARTLLLPSADYLRWSSGRQRPASLAIIYVTRPAGYLRDCLARRLARGRRVPAVGTR